MSKRSPQPRNPSTEPPLSYLVAGMTCNHCMVAVTEEVNKVAGVNTVEVDLDTQLIQVHGSDIDEAAVVAAIDDAGYEAVKA